MIRLLRPKQWTKNLLVFAALIFAEEYGDGAKVLLAVWAFVALCLVSSAIYSVNDVLDAEADRSHPTKRKRPIAAGELSPVAGLATMAVCLVGGTLVGAYFVGPDFLFGLYGYVLLQVLYNLGLKRAPVIDVMTISAGFVLRAALGAVAIDARISGWLLFCTGALALLLATAKRRNEFHLEGRGESRAVLKGYSAASIDSMVVFSAGIAAIAYGIYAIESETAQANPKLILTVPFVLFGILRYMYLTFAKDEGGEPESVLLGDWQTMAAVVLFLAAAFYALGGYDIPFMTLPTSP
ncbi:MAG: decaprenyl-phosphate phosphoribosyltransferase [Armatimonadetes bacterium]|nr:decaprenyl-phosphate phosphoribosyltransferase [Armatimonadota bacterium]